MAESEFGSRAGPTETASVVLLCFTLFVESTSEYRRGRRRITEPVVRVPANIVAAVKMDNETREAVGLAAKETVRELDKNRFAFRKTTGWLMALLVMATLGGGAYLGSNFFTREAQIAHMHEQLRRVQDDVEESQNDQQALERRGVDLEIQVELMQEKEL